MYGTNGLWQWLKQTLTPASWKRSAKAAWTKLQELPWGELLFYGAMLSVLVLALTACAVPSTLPTEPARNPQTPQLSEPLPSESYLQQAQKLIESWRKSVTGM
jgi:hypothetical protein